MNAFRLGRRFGLSLAGEVGVLLLTLVMLFVLVYPTAWVLIASFRTPETMFSATRWQFTFNNYASVMNAGFGRNILNSQIGRASCRERV